LASAQPHWSLEYVFRESNGTMSRITIFSFGYYGWGNATDELVNSVDAVERSRGFKPPIFVDTRISRSARAKGFNGSNFEKLVGEKSHRWMKSLGNKRIQSRSGPWIQIAEPAAAEDLLDLALELSEQSRRILFFCSCKFSKCEGKVNCHRHVIGTLLIKAARKRGASIEVIEWPGGKPQRIHLEVSASDYTAVDKGRSTIPLRETNRLVELAEVPYCSTLTLYSDDQMMYRLVGPARMTGGQWNLPVFYSSGNAATSVKEYQHVAKRMRRELGFDGRST
jgi:hypothetical protein